MSPHTPTPRRRLLRAVEVAVFVVAIAGGVVFGRAAAQAPDGASAPGAVEATVTPVQAEMASEVVTPSPVQVAAARTRALALVDVGAPRGWTVRFVAARSGDPRGTADRAHRAITVDVRAGDATHRVAHDLAHEIGHAWDATHMTAASRRAYLQRRGRPHAAWYPTAAGADYGSGAGDFAEVYARCHAASPDFRSTLAPGPADACAVLPPGARG